LPGTRLIRKAPGRHWQSALVATVVALVVLDFVASYLDGTGHLKRLARFFDGDEKVNFPNSFKILALMTSTALLYLLGRASAAIGDPYRRDWQVLAGVFLFLTIDEMTYFHQSLNSVVHDLLGGSGYLKYSWALLYLIVVLVLAVYLLPFLRRLQRPVLLRFMVAMVFFAGGSGGLEFIKGHLASGASGDHGLSFKLVSAVSDSAELIGLAVLVLTLVQLIGPAVTVHLDMPQWRPPMTSQSPPQMPGSAEPPVDNSQQIGSWLRLWP
jgi:hypothetical protein